MTPTGSRLGLADLCGYPFSPVSPPRPEDAADTDRDHGTAVHAAVAAALAGQPWTPPAAMTDAAVERVAGHALAWIDDAGFETTTPEVGYRLHPVTGAARVASGRGPSGYEDVRPGEIPLTVDIVATAPGVLAVIELKTGRPHPESHAWQVRTAALAVQSVGSRQICGGSAGILAILLYASEDGAYAVEERLDVFDLAEHAARLRALVAGLPARTTPTPGPHCTALHCPVRTVCPATQAALVRAVPAFPVAEIRTDDEARAVVAALPQAEAALDGWRAKLRAYVRARALPIEVDLDGDAVPGSPLYGWRSHVTRRVAKLTAERVQALRAALGPRAEAVLVPKLDPGVGEIEAAALAVARARKQAGEIDGIGKEAERILEALTAAGVLVVSEHERCETFRPAGAGRRPKV